MRERGALMSVLEQEIIERFQKLTPDAQKRVLQSLTITLQPTFDYAAWWQHVNALQVSIQASRGEGFIVGAVSLLDALREEES
jgi:hypothetical protein